MAEAVASIRNATAMTVATVGPDGRPSARMIICRGFDARAGWLVFYTDRESAKGHALAAHPYAACVFHWDAFERQVRVEGPVTLAPDADSDAHWKSRPPDAHAAVTASDQSRPIASRAALLTKVRDAPAHDGASLPRPARWGGYRVWAERVELWVAQPARVHDRAVWTRALQRAGDGFTGGAWAATRLQP
jgi:pyridoxamine 5'-phosphate oxidase